MAYLVNRYPHPTHTFIRREIAALEELGADVQRFSLRPASGELLEAADRRERCRTDVILSRTPVRIFCTALGAALHRPLRFLGALLLAVRCARSSSGGLIRHLAYVVEAAVLLRELQRLRIQHLHAHFGTNPATVAMLCRRLGGPHWSFTAHGPEEFDGSHALNLKLRHASLAIAVSADGLARLRRLAPSQGCAIRLVRCGVDGPFLHSASSDIPAEPRFVCVARLATQKGHEFLLHASVLLKAQGLPFELAIVGDGELRQPLQLLMQRLDLSSRVKLLGWRDESGVRAAIVASRALVLPSIAEGLPIVLMEALALGRPVIATDVGGVRELVLQGHCGWLVPPRSVHALAAAMRQALEMPARQLQRMGEAGARRVRRFHDADTQACILMHCWRELNASPRPAPGDNP